MPALLGVLNWCRRCPLAAPSAAGAAREGSVPHPQQAQRGRHAQGGCRAQGRPLVCLPACLSVVQEACGCPCGSCPPPAHPTSPQRHRYTPSMPCVLRPGCIQGIPSALERAAARAIIECPRPPTPPLLQVLVAEAWVPANSKAQVQEALHRAATAANAQVRPSACLACAAHCWALEYVCISCDVPCLHGESCCWVRRRGLPAQPFYPPRHPAKSSGAGPCTTFPHRMCMSAAQMGTVFQPMLTYEPPPTYFNVSKFTTAFQDIVDAYGGCWFSVLR